MNTTFNAREVWATQVPYFEPDIIVPTSLTPVTREMIYASTIRGRLALQVDATQRRPLALKTSLLANASVVEA